MLPFPEAPRSSWIRRLRNPPKQPGRKRKGPSLTTAGPPPQAASIVSLAAHYRKYFSAYHKRPALMQPVCTAVSSPCHSRFIPLPHGPKAWQAILGVSTWVMTMVRRGYSLQFVRRPLRFRGVLATTVLSENAHVLHAEVMNLLEKGAIELVPPAQSESGFYSCFFLIPQKMAACDLILDLRFLNHPLMKRLFRMITLKQILPQLCAHWRRHMCRANIPKHNFCLAKCTAKNFIWTI